MKAIKLVVSPQNQLIIPFAHFGILQGMVYKMLSNNPTLSEEIHNRKYNNKTSFKFFCFTDIKGRYKIRGKTLVYGNFEWEIRSADDRIIDEIYRYVLENDNIVIEGYPCSILSVEFITKNFKSNKVKFFAETPIVACESLESGFTVYHNPFQKEFKEKVISNIINKYTIFYGKPPDNKIDFVCLNPDDKHKCVTKYKSTIITAWYGNYIIEADNTVMDFIYHTGLGGKNSIGFGTISELLS